MTTQEKFRRERYIECEKYIAEVKAAAFYDEHFPEQPRQPRVAVTAPAAGDHATDDEEILDLKAAAALLGRAPRTLRRYVENGKLRCVENMRPNLHFRRKTLDRFIRDR